MGTPPNGSESYWDWAAGTMMAGSMLVAVCELISIKTATLPRMKAATAAPLTEELGRNSHVPDADAGDSGDVGGASRSGTP